MDDSKICYDAQTAMPCYPIPIKNKMAVSFLLL